MGKFLIVIDHVEATPRDFPVNILNKLKRRLKDHLLHNVGPMIKKDMEATVRNWKTAPEFPVVYSEPYGTRIQLTVQPKGKGSIKWKRISVGTGPRTIRAKKPKGMRFQRNYDPKTTPGGRYGGPGRKHGPWVRTQLVRRHVIKPRKFTQHIVDRREKEIIRGVRRIVKRTL